MTQSKFQFLDIVKLSQMLNRGSIPKVNLAVLLGKQVQPPVDFTGLVLPYNTAFVEATLLCGAFNRGTLERYAISEEYRNTIRLGMKNVHLLEGKITVLVPDSYINSGLASVFGRLSPCRGSKCVFYMAQWGYDRISSAYSSKAVEVSSPTESMYSVPYYQWLQQCVSSNNYTKPIPCSSKLQITGIEREEVEPPRVISADVVSALKAGVTDTTEAVGVYSSEVPQKMGVGEQYDIVSETGVNYFNSSPIPTAFKPLVMTSDVDIFRQKIVKTTEKSKQVHSLLEECTSKLENAVVGMKTTKSFEDASIKMFMQTIPPYWTRRPSGTGSTGRDIFFTACRKVLDSKVSADDSDDLDEDVKTPKDKFNLDAVAELYRTNPKVVEIWGNCEKESGLEFLRQNRSAILYALFDTVLELSCDFGVLYKVCENRDIDLLDLISKNPYKLCFISSSVTLEDMDKLAMVVELFNKDGEIKKYRTIAYVHFYMCDGNNEIINSGTVIQRSELERVMRVGYVLSSTERRRMTSTDGVYLKEKVYQNIQAYFIGMKPEHCKLPLGSNWVRLDTYHEFLSMGVTNKQAIDWYVESGMGIQTALSGVLSISDYTMTSKEEFIYRKLQRIFKKRDTDSFDNIDDIISDFEKMKSKELGISEFRLEERQKEAVKMVGTPIYAVIGGAGCGKTTTAEAIVYALKELYELTDDDIVFAAPTGKAANRLKESVKHDTRTIHSLFGIRGSSTFILNDESGTKLSDIKALVLDECSMINLDVMHTIMRGIRDDIIIVMLGDIAQLPPIGFGKPFANLLTFIPCVRLNVSKRASAKSTITRNANALLTNDTDKMVNLQNGTDFQNIVTSESEVIDCISSIVKYHLGLVDSISYPTVELGVLDKNDIQVVTPVRKSSYTWGSDKLNEVLQNIFNPYKSQRALYILRGNGDKIEYRVGDRVIHTKNISDMPHYVLTNGSFEAVDEGIVNGEVGVVKRMILADEMKSFTEDVSLLRYAKSDSMLFLEVEYENVDMGSNGSSKFSIMYPVKCSDTVEGSGLGSYGMMDGRFVTTSGTLSLISLAYALTVHKMQGSQAKLIIAPLFKMRKKGFISRNMVYTALTRASKGCYLVGDVSNRGTTLSALSEARNIEVTGSRLTLFEQFTNE